MTDPREELRQKLYRMRRDDCFSEGTEARLLEMFETVYQAGAAAEREACVALVNNFDAEDLTRNSALAALCKSIRARGRST